MQKIIELDKKINLTQMLRALHALSEADCLISIPKTESYKLELLKEKFNFKFIIDYQADKKVSQLIMINHKQPQTKIGDISRILIFPNSIVNYCRSIWTNERPYKFTFTGLITKKRKLIINQWLRDKYKLKKIRIPQSDSLFFKLKSKLFSLLKIDATICKQYKDILFWSTSNKNNIIAQIFGQLIKEDLFLLNRGMMITTKY